MHDDARRDPEFRLDLVKHPRNVLGLVQVHWNEKLVRVARAVLARRHGHAVALGGKGFGQVGADVGAGAEDEEDGGGHGRIHGTDVMGGTLVCV